MIQDSRFRNKKKWHLIAATLCALLLVAGAFLIKEKKTEAQTGGLPFGGIIGHTEYCCDGSVLLTVGPPNAGLFLYTPYISILFSYFNVFTPGPWVLGNTYPGGFCDLIEAECEAGIPAEGTISIVGTSL